MGEEIAENSTGANESEQESVKDDSKTNNNTSTQRNGRGQRGRKNSANKNGKGGNTEKTVKPPTVDGSAKTGPLAGVTVGLDGSIRDKIEMVTNLKNKFIDLLKQSTNEKDTHILNNITVDKKMTTPDWHGHVQLIDEAEYTNADGVVDKQLQYVLEKIQDKQIKDWSGAF